MNMRVPPQKRPKTVKNHTNVQLYTGIAFRIYLTEKTNIINP